MDTLPAYEYDHVHVTNRPFVLTMQTQYPSDRETGNQRQHPTDKRLPVVSGSVVANGMTPTV